MDSEVKQSKMDTLGYAVFIFSAIIIGINTFLLIFPAFITILVGTESGIDPFTQGQWAIPIIITNFIILDFGLLYYTKKLPKKIQGVIKNSINFILDFEVSKKVTIIVIVVLLGTYIALTVDELGIAERAQWPDFKSRIEPVLKDFPNNEEGAIVIRVLFVKNFLLYSSQEIFDNVKVIPFIGSIALLLVTYFFTAKIANKRFAGLVAIVVILQSDLFRTYDTAATYSYFWVLLYLLSLYLMCTKRHLSSVAYFLSIFSKPITAAFFPMSIFFLYRTNLKTRKKIQVLIPYIVIISLLIGMIFFAGINLASKNIGFDMNDFWGGFNTISSHIRSDGLVIIFMVPLLFGLFVTSRRGIPHADSIQLLIAGTLLAAPLLAAFTGFNVNPYRHVMFIVFFAVGVGMVLSKRSFRSN